METYEKGGVYKKIVHKDGMIIGALLQGDLAYGGVLQQMIARRIDVRRVKKPLFDIDYSDFFHIRENTYEFYYDREPFLRPDLLSRDCQGGGSPCRVCDHSI